MRKFYTAIFYSILPLILLRAVWRQRGAAKELKKLAERIGFYAAEQPTDSIWLHAVSYGEAVAAEPLIKQLRSFFPHQLIVVTTMTLTGAVRIQSSWKQDSLVKHYYLPYDLPFFIKRFFKQAKPRFGILMETELWPNLLYLAGKRKLPLFLANARLSPKSFQGYQQIKKFMSPLLQNLTFVAAQSEEDAQRFSALGVPEHRVSNLGNVKFDILPPAEQIAAGIALKSQLPSDLILVAASTHANEEEQILTVYAKLRQHYPQLLLVLVPRHPQRFDEVAALCSSTGLTITRRSAQQMPSADTQVYLGDSMGELYFYYALADVAFVGGSLVPIGGHNLLEPAAVKLPIVSGPHLRNFKTISALLHEVKALYTADNADELFEIIKGLFDDRDVREQAGRAGYEILAKNQGATDRHLSVITRCLEC